MDEIVRQAMAKWPNVPAVYGWLALDRRGQWLLKDESIGNPMLIEFINRNYDHDAQGRWFFQNGPQRVYVRLAYAPWVLRTTGEQTFVTHTGLAVTTILGLWFDEDGVVTLQTEHGPGILDDRDVEAIACRFRASDGRVPDEDDLLEAIERTIDGAIGLLAFDYRGATVPVSRTTSVNVPLMLGFTRDPLPDETAAHAAP